METRRSSRLRLVVNNSAKQRLSRFIRRNLDLIDSTTCIRKSNTLKNRLRSSENTNETTRNLRRAYSSTTKATSESLRKSTTKGKSNSSLKKTVMPTETESKCQRTRGHLKEPGKYLNDSAEVSKKTRMPVEKSAASSPPEEPDSSTRTVRRSTSVASLKSKGGTIKKPFSFTMKPDLHSSAGELKQNTTKKPGTAPRKLNSRMKTLVVSPKISHSSARNLIDLETSKSFAEDSNISPKRTNFSTRNILDSSMRKICRSAADSFVASKKLNPSGRNTETISSSENTAISSNSSTPFANSKFLYSEESNSPVEHRDVFPSESKPQVNVVHSLMGSDAQFQLKSESFPRISDVLAEKRGSSVKNSDVASGESKTLAKSHSPTANSIISLSDSDSSSANEAVFTQSKSFDLSDDKPDASGTKSVGSPKPHPNAYGKRLESPSRNDGVPSRKTSVLHNKPDSNFTQSDPKQLNSQGKKPDLHSRTAACLKKSKTGDADLGLDTLKRTLVDLFTSGDSVKTLPFIHSNWPEKCVGHQPNRLPSPRNTNQTDEQNSTGFLSVIGVKINSYYVQCQLNEVEWVTMYYVARRWNWVRDLELTHETKYFIVKEESFQEDFDGIPENVLKANAFGGCVLLFEYVQECAAEGKLIEIRKSHIPNHKGTRRKILGRYRLTPMFDDFAFFITPEICGERHERDNALLRLLLRLTRSKLCSSLEELRKSSAKNKVALRSTALSVLEDVRFVHYHWLYECILNYKLYPLESYSWEFTAYWLNGVNQPF